MRQQPCLYFDLDGVLADMNSEIIRIAGKSYDQLTHPEKIELWQVLENYSDFFMDLQVLPGAVEFVAKVTVLANQADCQVGVLTAIPLFGKLPLAKEHKEAWVKHHFPALSHNFNIGPFAVDKQKHCKPGDILIDDSYLNIQQWRMKQGHGILHASIEDSMQQVIRLFAA